MKRVVILPLFLLLVGLCGIRSEGAAATEETQPAPFIVDMAVAPHGQGKNFAAHGTITNKGENPIRIIDISFEGASKSELHAHENDNGTMKMRKVPAIQIRDAHTFARGGDHFMGFGAGANKEAGDTIRVKIVYVVDDGTPEAVRHTEVDLPVTNY